MTFGAFAMERTLDLLAERLGLDPAEIRRRNLIPPEAYPFTSAWGYVYDSGDYPRALTDALDLAGYARLRAEQSAARGAGRLVGVGLSCYTEYTGIGARTYRGRGMVEVPGHEAATVSVDGDGTRLLRSLVSVPRPGPRDHGGPARGRSSGRRARRGDPAPGRYRPHAAGQRHLCQPRRRRPERGGRRRRQPCPRPPARPRRRTGWRRARPTSSSWRRGARARRSRTRPPHRRCSCPTGRPPVGAGGLRPARARPSRARCTWPRWRSTPGTGRVAVREYTVVEDCGPVINPLIVEGQIHGAVSHGIAEALGESLATIARASCSPARSWTMPCLSPRTRRRSSSAMSRRPSPLTPGGYKGMGEGGTIGAPAAIASAVADAVRPLGLTVTGCRSGPRACGRR